MKLLLLIALLPFAALAEVKPLRLYVVHATGPNALSRTDLDDALSRVRKVFTHEFHIPTRIIRYKEVKNTCNMSTFSFPLQLGCTKKWGLKKGKRVVNVAILPPLVDEKGFRYIGGAAYNGEVNPGNIFFASQLFNNNGDPRFWHVVNGILHELAHTGSARHIDTSINLMNRNASQYVTEGILPVLPKTKREVKKCLNRR